MDADLAAVAAFTRVRLAELKAAAREAIEETRHCDRCDASANGEWAVHPAHAPLLRDEGSDATVVYDEERNGLLAYIALNDPAHALRVARFGRTLLALHEKLASPKTILERITFPALAELTVGIIRDFAAIWEKHPEYPEGSGS